VVQGKGDNLNRLLSKLNFELRKTLKIPFIKDNETGCKFVIGGGIFDEIYKERVYDYFGFKRHWNVIDVGAHVGFFTIRAAKCCKKVVAIEPDKSNFSLLKRHIQMNRCKNVIALNVGVWKKDGIKKFYISHYHGTHSLVFGQRNRFEYIPVFTLATLLKDLKIRKIDLVKVDAEGAELEVLKGSIKILKKIRRWIVVAEHHKPTNEFEKVKRFLEKSGYKIYVDEKRKIVYAEC
jgi:FkbM family methyltransferase